MKDFNKVTVENYTIFVKQLRGSYVEGDFHILYKKDGEDTLNECPYFHYRYTSFGFIWTEIADAFYYTYLK